MNPKCTVTLLYVQEENESWHLLHSFSFLTNQDSVGYPAVFHCQLFI